MLSNTPELRDEGVMDCSVKIYSLGLPEFQIPSMQMHPTTFNIRTGMCVHMHYEKLQNAANEVNLRVACPPPAASLRYSPSRGRKCAQKYASEFEFPLHCPVETYFFNKINSSWKLCKIEFYSSQTRYHFKFVAVAREWQRSN